MGHSGNNRRCRHMYWGSRFTFPGTGTHGRRRLLKSTYTTAYATTYTANVSSSIGQSQTAWTSRSVEAPDNLSRRSKVTGREAVPYGLRAVIRPQIPSWRRVCFRAKVSETRSCYSIPTHCGSDAANIRVPGHIDMIGPGRRDMSLR